MSKYSKFFKPSEKPSANEQDQDLVNQIYDKHFARMNLQQATRALNHPGDCIVRIGKTNRKAALNRRDTKEKASLLKTKRFNVDYMDDQGNVQHLTASFANGTITAGEFSANSVDALKSLISQKFAPQAEVSRSTTPREKETIIPGKKLF